MNVADIARQLCRSDPPATGEHEISEGHVQTVLDAIYYPDEDMITAGLGGGRRSYQEREELIRAWMAMLRAIDSAPSCWRGAPAVGEREGPSGLLTSPHPTTPIKVWVDVDAGIADFVLALNEIPGIRTLASCQGTIGEGGPNPYEAQVMVTWADDAALARLSHLRMTRLGPNYGYLHA